MNRNIHTKYILINKDILVNAYTMGKYPNNQLFIHYLYDSLQ